MMGCGGRTQCVPTGLRRRRGDLRSPACGGCERI